MVRQCRRLLFGWFSFLLLIFIWYQLFVSLAHTHHSIIAMMISHHILSHSIRNVDATSHIISKTTTTKIRERRWEKKQSPCFLLPFQLSIPHVNNCNAIIYWWYSDRFVYSESINYVDLNWLMSFRLKGARVRIHTRDCVRVHMKWYNVVYAKFLLFRRQKKNISIHMQNLLHISSNLNTGNKTFRLYLFAHIHIHTHVVQSYISNSLLNSHSTAKSKYFVTLAQF